MICTNTANTAPSIFSAENISCGYEKKIILSDVSFSLVAGSITCLLGPNGAGKSTLIKTLAGLLSPLSGRVIFTTETHARAVSYVPQEYASHAFSVLDTVVMGRAQHLGFKSSPEKSDYDIARKTLDSLNLSNLTDAAFDTLSGGQKRLVLTARAFAAQSPVVLLDEPDSGLDAVNKKVLYSALKTCAKSGRAVLVSSHDIDSVRALQAKILLVGTGIVAACPALTAKKLRSIYGTDFVPAVIQRGRAPSSESDVVFLPDF